MCMRGKDLQLGFRTDPNKGNSVESPLFIGDYVCASRAYAKENFGVVSDGAPVERERE